MIAQLSQLVISNIRNLEETSLNFGPRFNVFIGSNGSGKTSLLEAIYLLGAGRSFRARSVQQVIAFGAEQCLVRAKLSEHLDYGAGGVWLGVERGVNGDAQYRVGEQNEKSSAELTRLLPVQLIDVNSTSLLEGGPNCRRQFIDWGVFHVEHTFLDNWRLMRRALEQRNASLKRKQKPSAVWDEAFVKYSTIVDEARRGYVDKFMAIFTSMLQEMLGMTGVSLLYLSGWGQDRTLSAALEATANIDLAYGYTNRGPHRADLEILQHGRPVKAVLSRGQLKIFTCIMLLARAKLLEKERSSIFLIDDLHAELDTKSCSLIVDAINAMDCQAFITGIEAELLSARLQACETRMFHVEQGRISEYAR